MTALSFLDYFNSEAEITNYVRYYGHYYDEVAIYSDLKKYKLSVASELITSLRTQIVTSGNSDIFERSTPIAHLDTILPDFGPMAKLIDYFGEMRSAMKFTPNPIAASYLPSDPGFVTNKAFYETTFIDTLSKILDRKTLYITMKIILAHRIVMTHLDFTNNGTLPAKNIRIYLRAPSLIRPRHLQSEAKVEFLKIEPDYPNYSLENTRYCASILLPFLNHNDIQRFIITSTLTNITERNIFIDYESDRAINPCRIIIIFLICAVVLYASPFLLNIGIGTIRRIRLKS